MLTIKRSDDETGFTRTFVELIQLFLDDATDSGLFPVAVIYHRRARTPLTAIGYATCEHHNGTLVALQIADTERGNLRIPIDDITAVEISTDIAAA